MNKFLFFVTLLCLSFSSVSYGGVNNATDFKSSDNLQAIQVGEIFSDYLPMGARVGICEVKQSQFNSNNEYIIEVKEGLGLLGFYHNVRYTLKTPSVIKYNDNTFMITNSYKFKEFNVSGQRVLQMKAKKLASGELKVLGIFIETKSTNGLGEKVLNNEESVHCLNRQ